LIFIGPIWERSTRTETVSSRGRTWRIDWLRYSSIGDQIVQGWLAVPLDHDMTGAGMLWLPGYSYGTPSPDDSDLVDGVVSFGINVHGHPPDHPYVNPAGKDDYILSGIDDPAIYIYRSIVGHCLCAVDVLEKQPEVTKGLAVAGMSQGGGLALLVASQDKRPLVCCADMPFLADIRSALILSRSPAYRALREHIEINPRSLNTVLLFDPLLHARRITVPTWLSAGGKDPNCKPPTVEAVYRDLAAIDKEYEYFPTAGHVFLPQMNAAYDRLIQKYISGARPEFS
jgi:cephalosporin-C deacetylase